MSAHDFDLTPLDGEEPEELSEGARRVRMLTRAVVASVIVLVAIIAE